MSAGAAGAAAPRVIRQLACAARCDWGGESAPGGERPCAPRRSGSPRPARAWGCGAGPWLFSSHGVAGCSTRQLNRLGGPPCGRSCIAGLAREARQVDPGSRQSPHAWDAIEGKQKKLRSGLDFAGGGVGCPQFRCPRDTSGGGNDDDRRYQHRRGRACGAFVHLHPAGVSCRRAAWASRLEPALAKRDGGSERTPCREMKRACHGHCPIPNPRREK